MGSLILLIQQGRQEARRKWKKSRKREGKERKWKEGKERCTGDVDLRMEGYVEGKCERVQKQVEKQSWTSICTEMCNNQTKDTTEEEGRVGISSQWAQHWTDIRLIFPPNILSKIWSETEGGKGRYNTNKGTYRKETVDVKHRRLDY